MPESVASSFLSRMGSRSSISNREYKATVQLLDDNETISVDFKKGDTGQVLFDYVCECLNIVEKDYFGLRYMDNFKNRYWLDPAKPIFRQIKGMFEGVSGIVLRFRVRFYPREPWEAREELTRYQLFLQLRRDLLHGRLYAPQADAAHLGAFIVQSELGTYDPAEHLDGYVSEYKLFLKQTQKLEERIASVHATLGSMSPAQAETAFLKRAATLDTYGYDPYTVKDTKGHQLYLGVTHRGILVYQSNRKIHHIPWEELEKVDYLGKELTITPKASYTPLSLNTTLNSTTSASQTSPAKWKKEKGGSGVLRYTCASGSFCKHLWKYTLGQQAFFTKGSKAEVSEVRSKARIPLLARGSTFRYTGRVLAEIKEGEETGTGREEPSFIRYHLERQPSRADRGFPWMSKYSTLPRLKAKPSIEEELPPRAHEAPVSVSASGHSLNRPESPEDPRLTLAGVSPALADFSPREPLDTSEALAVEVDQAKLLTSTPLKETELRQRVSAKRNGGPAEAATTVTETGQAGRGGTICGRLLTWLLLGLLVAGLVVAGMEVAESQPSYRRAAHSLPGFSAFQEKAYLPARAQILAAYRALFPE